MFAINTENLKYVFFKKHYVFLLFAKSLKMNIKKIFKEEESIGILKILGFITFNY